MSKISRRNFIRLALFSLPIGFIADSFLIEPEWVVIRKFNLGGRKPRYRIVHFTDLHYKGDRSYLTRVIEKINELSPDFVCFTGDIVEDTFYLKEALELLGKIRSPLFGAPGNHDYWSGASFPKIALYFKSTGGAWLVDEETTNTDGKISIVGSAGKNVNFMQTAKSFKKLFLMHYPALVSEIRNERFDLILAGHSHGGQVRIPFIGALSLPYGVGKYDRGMFNTKAGSLYVNPGIGTWYLPIRFNCRPEITVFEI